MDVPITLNFSNTRCIRFVEKHKPLADEHVLQFIIDKLFVKYKMPISDIEYTHVMRNTSNSALRKFFHRLATTHNHSVGSDEPKLSLYLIVQASLSSPIFKSIRSDFDDDGYFKDDDSPTLSICDSISSSELTHILKGHRGSQIEEGKCCVCKDFFNHGWRYKVDDIIYMICHDCKLKYKGNNEYVQFISTPMK